MDGISKEDGLGESGVKVMVLETYNSAKSSQKTAYILLDSNNMIMGFREKIMEKVLGVGLDQVEVMTTDTHYVNTFSGGHNPIGKKKQDEIMKFILKCTEEAIDDLEEVSVGFKVSNIKDIKTLGPTHATELVTTISSIVAVSRVFAPFIFILALLIVFIWIFYYAF